MNHRRDKYKDVYGVKTMRGVILNPNTTRSVPLLRRLAGGKADNNNSNKAIIILSNLQPTTDTDSKQSWI